MTVKRYSEVANMLGFWDEARPGEVCMVPCWPLDGSGDAMDCEDQLVLVGVLGSDQLVRAEEVPAFVPSRTIWTCGRHPFNPTLDYLG